jgi:hypothetical protein
VDHRLEHWGEIAGRGVDDLEHVARRSLVFERLLQITRALPQFAQEPRILHRDHRLRGEAFQHCNLFIREGPYF